MNLRKILKSRAKTYPKQPFEMKIVLGIFLYMLIALITIGDVVISSFLLLKRNSSRLRITLSLLTNFINSTVVSSVKIIHVKLVEKLTLPVTKMRTVFTTLRSYRPQVHKSLFIKRKKRGRKKKAVPVYPRFFYFRQKVLYFSCGTMFSFLFLFLPLLFLIFVQSLPSPYELTIRQVPQTTKIYDRNGVLLDQIYATQNRTIVPLKDIPLTLQHATLAIEDKNFYTHPGFDITAMARAAKEIMTGGTFQGGSTITQQLIKSAMLTPEPSIMRKVKELALAFWAERIYNKKQILQMYFNHVPYGGTAWGVEAAAEVYFSKPVKELTLAESAFLAGITSAPTIYSPYGESPTAWKSRQKEVLHRMVALHYITPQESLAAEKEKLVFKSQEIPQYAPHFVNYIKDMLIGKYGLATVEKGGLSVITSIDVTTQQMAQKVVTDEVNASAYLNLHNGAAIISHPQTGDIIAMVGGKDFSNPHGGNVNIATSYQQPGSSIKVVTYSAALANGMTAASIIEDRPTAFPIQGQAPYTPVNYDGHYFGRIPLRFALANSLNVPAVKVLKEVGIDSMVDLARDMGIKTWLDKEEFGLSVTLGGSEVTMLDMATVFSTLANQGERVDLNPILKITDANGKVYEEKKAETILRKRVLSSDVAFIISDILADPQTRSYAFGPNSPLQIPGHTVSVKTGTTDEKRDNWAVGYTNNHVVTVWVGNTDNSPMSQRLASGITGATPIWNKLMTSLLAKNPETRFSVPTNVTQKMCFGRVEYFVRGTENGAPCNLPQRPNTYSSLPTQFPRQ